MGFNFMAVITILVIACGFFLEYSGVKMIYMDLRTEGSISINMPYFEGSMNATYIGLLVILMGIVLQVVCIRSNYTAERFTLMDKRGPNADRVRAQRGPGGSTY
jgi:hypothetical protein